MTVSGTVYGLALNDGTYRYIGVTIRPLEQRLTGHVRDALRGKTAPVYVWMRAVGVENVRAVPIYTHVPVDDLASIEKHLISDMRESHKLLNSSGGGEGVRLTRSSRSSTCGVCRLTQSMIDQINENRVQNPKKFTYRVITNWLKHEGVSIGYCSVRNHFFAKHHERV